APSGGWGPYARSARSIGGRLGTGPRQGGGRSRPPGRSPTGAGNGRSRRRPRRCYPWTPPPRHAREAGGGDGSPLRRPRDPRSPSGCRARRRAPPRSARRPPSPRRRVVGGRRPTSWGLRGRGPFGGCVGHREQVHRGREQVAPGEELGLGPAIAEQDVSLALLESPRAKDEKIAGADPHLFLHLPRDPSHPRDVVFAHHADPGGTEQLTRDPEHFSAGASRE